MSDSVRPHRRQPTRLPRPWDSPSKKTGVGCHFLLHAWKWKVKVKSLNRVRLLVTPWTAAYQTPPSMGFSRREYWSGVPLPSPINNVYPSLNITPEGWILGYVWGHSSFVSFPSLEKFWISGSLVWLYFLLPCYMLKGLKSSDHMESLKLIESHTHIHTHILLT